MKQSDFNKLSDEQRYAAFDKIRRQFQDSKVVNETLSNLHNMSAIEINQIAFDKLNELLTRCTPTLVSHLTGVSRPTLQRWLDNDRALEQMDSKVSGWFILVCATSPKIKLLLDRPPLTYPRLASRLLNEGEQQ